MTMPDERTRAVQATERLLLDLLSPTATPRVPAAIRERAAWCLRHFPGGYDLNRAARGAPDTWGKPE